MMIHVVFDEPLDKPVGVIVSGMAAQGKLLSRFRRCCLQGLRMQLRLHELIAVDRLMPADLGILEAVGFLLGREHLDILAQGALIAFEREDVIGDAVATFPTQMGRRGSP